MLQEQEHRMLFCQKSCKEAQQISQTVRHVDLATHPNFRLILSRNEFFGTKIATTAFLLCRNSSDQIGQSFDYSFRTV
jgi:hypothetical protein